MPTFDIVPGKPWHCGQMVRLLRLEQMQVEALLGVDAHATLRQRFDQSPSFRRAWLIDGRLAALGGVTGSLASPDGFVWLAVARFALCYPKAMVRTARAQIAEIMKTRHELHTTLLDGDAASRRFAVFLGFVPLGGTWRRAPISRSGRAMLLDDIEHNDKSRIPVGAGTMTAMHYCEAEA